MHQKDAFEPLPFKRPLPRNGPGNQSWDGSDNSTGEIVIGYRRKEWLLGSLREEIKENANHAGQ